MTIQTTPGFRRALLGWHRDCMFPNAHKLRPDTAQFRIDILRAYIEFVRTSTNPWEKSYHGISIPEAEEAIRRATVHVSGFKKDVGHYLEAKRREREDELKKAARIVKSRISAKTTARAR